MTRRLIPRLDIKGRDLIKGIHLEGLRVLGAPEVFAHRYYLDGADELMLVDSVASLYGRNTAMDIVSTVARQVFIPLIVGGGIRTVADIRHALSCGADKVMINTAAINRPEFINEAANMFGSSTIVIAIEAIRHNGGYVCVTDNGREMTDREPVEWAKEAAARGAGEICITSVDHEGTGIGFDVRLTNAVWDAVHCPVIAHGGCGWPEHVKQVKADVALASILHYRTVREIEPVFVGSGNREFLKRRTDGFACVQDSTIAEVRACL